MAYLLKQTIPQSTLSDFCKKNHIKKLSVFGSAINGTLTPESDIDLLVEFDPNHTPGLFSVVRMEIELTKMLGRKADLRTFEDLSPYFRNEVAKNAELQYQA